MAAGVDVEPVQAVAAVSVKPDASCEEVEAAVVAVEQVEAKLVEQGKPVEAAEVHTVVV